MANPFYVPALGGLQTFQNIGSSVAAGIEQNQAENARQQLMQQAAEVMDRGNPREIAQFSMQNPEIGESMLGGIKFANEATKSNLRDSMQRVIAGEDPVQVLQERVQMVQAQGGDASDSMRELQLAQQDPEAYRQQVEQVFAMSYPREYEAFRKATGAGDSLNIGQYNPRDYTTDSFAQFVETGDPSVLERYANQQSVDIGGVPHVFDPSIGGYRPASVVGGRPSRDGQQGRPDAPITAEDVAGSRGTIVAAEERAKQEVKEGSPKSQQERREAISKSRANIASTADVVSQVDSIIDNENYLDSLTGVRGVLPAAPGTSGYDATVALDRLKNSLTLGNLDKMSGVLSESDIKILASEAGGLEAGMSRESMIDRLTEIRSVFQSKTEEERKKLREMMKQSEGQQQAGGQMSEQDADAFINSVLGQ